MSKKMVECKACGKEIAKSAKTCPSCGAKNKKPLFRKWWFWALIVCILCGSMASGGEESAQTEESTPTVAEVQMQAQEDQASSEETQVSTETTAAETEPTDDLTMGQANALSSAKSYLSFSAFSYDGLIKQLEFEGYTNEEAVYAADHCEADWNEQALKSADNYLDFTAFSYDGLIEQLEFEGFTTEQATYAAENCGADWFEQAVKCAKSYLDFGSFSKEGLIEQLEFEGFTHEQAVYGVEQNGY